MLILINNDFIWILHMEVYEDLALYMWVTNILILAFSVFPKSYDFCLRYINNIFKFV